MFYLFTLDSHDLYGPFLSHATAHAFAAKRQFGSYAIDPDSYWQKRQVMPEICLVPAADR